MKPIPWILSVIIMVTIFLISGTSADRIDTVMGAVRSFLNIESVDSAGSDSLINIDWLKVGHFIGYGMLGCSLYFAYVQKSIRPILFVVLTVFLYACSDEFHQTFVPGRSGSFSDVILDVASALLISLLIHHRISAKTD